MLPLVSRNSSNAPLSCHGISDTPVVAWRAHVLLYQEALRFPVPSRPGLQVTGVGTGVSRALEQQSAIHGNVKIMAGGVQNNADPEFVRIFERYRPLLFSIAYSILGIVADAQDMTRETLHRWLQHPDHRPSRARIFLVTTIATLCVDYLQHTEIRHGNRVPVEPGANSCQCRLSDGAGLNSISTTCLTLLNRLTPTERVVFLLEVIFRYDYSQIAHALGKDEAQCRKIAHRVKAYMIRNRARADFSPSLHVSQI